MLSEPVLASAVETAGAIESLRGQEVSHKRVQVHEPGTGKAARGEMFEKGEARVNTVAQAVKEAGVSVAIC